MADVNANIGVNIDTSEALAQLKDLQRQISQFHTSIAKSSEAAALAQRDLQRNFINSVNALGAFSAELRTVKTTSESFTTSLEKNKFSMREYFRYAGAATKTFGRLFKSEFDTISKVAEDRVKTLQTQYIKMGRDASGAMKAIAVRPDQLDMGNYSTQLQIAAQKQALFNQLMKQGSTNLLNFGKNTQWAGRQLMVGFTLPLMALGSAASKTFMDMEAQALKFRKVYGDLFTTSAETDQALASIQALGREFTKYGVAVSDTVGLAADAAAAGFSGLDLQRQTTEATRLSVLGQIDNQQALQTTISLQNAFGISSADLAANIDFLNAVENQTVTSLDDITIAIPKVAPVIKQLGGDVKDLAFFLTAMKEGGVNASEGANALKSGLAALINPTNSARNMLKGMNIDIDAIVNNNKGDLKATVIGFAQALDTLAPLQRARAIETMFGKFQFARLSTLFQNVTKDGTQAARVLELAGSSVQDLANLSNKELGMTAESAMNKFKKSVEDLKVSIIPVGEAFLKTITPIIEAVSKIAEKFGNLSDGTKKAITTVITVIGGLGPILLMTFGLLANGVANIIKLFLTLRTGYQRLTGQSKNLGEQTQYMTMEQLDAAAAAHSLNQAHATLTQQFTAEATAIQELIVAYQAATAAGAKFAMANPGMMMPLRKMADGGLVVGPGSETSDSVPVMLSNGESVIPADRTKQYGGLISGIIAGSIPGFAFGVQGFDPSAVRSSGSYRRTNNLALERAQRMAAEQQGAVAGGINFNGVNYQIPTSSRTTMQAIEQVFARFSKDVEGIAMALEALQANAQELGSSFNNITATSLKTFMDEIGVARNTPKGVSSSGGYVFAHAQERGQDVKDIQELERLVALSSDTTKGIGKYLKASLETLKAGEAAKVQLAEAEQEQAALIQRLNAAKTDEEKAAIKTQLIAIEEIKSAAQGMIKAAEGAKVYTLSNFGFVLPEAANKGKMAPKDVAEQFTGDNISRTMAPIYAEYARKLGMSLDDALANPQIAAQMHADMAKFGQLISDEIGGVTTEFLSDPDFYAAVERARQGLTGVVSDILIDAVNDLKKTSTVVTQGGQVNRGSEGQRIALAQKEQALREYLGAAEGGNSYRDVGTAGYVAMGENIGSKAVAAVAVGAGTASPSKKTIPIGEDIARGVEVGMQQETDNVVTTAENMARQAIAGVQRGARTPGNVTPGAPTTIEKTRGGQTISVIQKNVVEERLQKSAQETAQRLNKLNNTIMGSTFALTSLAGAGQMLGGRIGEISNTIFNLSGIMFGLMSVTQLLTRESFLLYVARMKEVALTGKFGNLLGNIVQSKIGSKVMGSAIGRGATSVAGRIGLGAAAGAGAAEGGAVAAGVAGGTMATGGALLLVLAAAAAVAGTLWLVNKRHRDSIKEIEGLGNAAHIAASELEAIKTATGTNLSKTAFEAPTMFGTSTETQSKVSQFQTAIKDSKELMARVEALKGATSAQAAATLQSFGIELIARGMDPKTTQDFIRAMANMSGNAGLIAKAKIELDTVDLQKELNGTVTIFDRAFNPAINAANQGGKELEKNLTLVAGVTASAFGSLSAQFSQGKITAEQFNNGVVAIKRNIDKLGRPQSLYVLRKALIDLNPQMKLAANNIKSGSDAFKLMQIGAQGVDLSGFIAQIQTAGTVTDQLRSKINATLSTAARLASLKAQLAAMEEANKASSATGGGESGSSGTATEDARLAYLRKAQAKLTIAAILTIEKPSEADFKNRVDGIIESINNELKSVDVKLAIDPKSINSIGDIDIALKRIDMDVEKQITPAYRAAQFQIEDLKKTTEDYAHENEVINHELDKMEKFYSKQKDALAEVGRLESYNNAQRKRQVTLADALTSGDISAAAQAANDMRAAQADFANETQQKALDNNPILLSLREQIANNDEKIWEVNQKIYDIQKESIDPVDQRIKALDREKTLLTDIQNDYKSAVDFAKAKLLIDGMTADQIEREITLRQAQIELQKGAGSSGGGTIAGPKIDVSKIKAEIAALEKQLAELVPTDEPITNWFARQWNSIKIIWGKFASWWSENVWQPIKNSALGSWLSTQFEAVDKRWQEVTKSMKERWNSLTENLGVLVETGAALFRALQELWDEYVIAPIKEQWTQFTTWFGISVVEPLKTRFNEFRSWFGINIIDPIKTRWTEFTSWFGTNVIEPIKVLWNGFRTWIDTTFINPIRERFRTITEPIQTAITNIGIWWETWKTKTFDQKIETFKNSFKTIFDPATWTSWFQNAISGLDSVFKSFINNTIIDRLNGIRLTIPTSIFGVKVPIIGGQSWGFNIQRLASGGLVSPAYMASGGYAMGTDTVPAMLTPGEFVIKKFAVDKFGVDNLKAINDGTFMPRSSVASVNNNSNSVYNYGVTVNVSHANASTQDIAKAVITQIRNIDNQRIRGQR